MELRKSVNNTKMDFKEVNFSPELFKTDECLWL